LYCLFVDISISPRSTNSAARSSHSRAGAATVMLVLSGV
jgi:hypothetical protein